MEEAKLKVKVTEWHIKKPPVIIKQPQTIRFRRLGLGHAVSTIRSVPVSVYIKDQWDESRQLTEHFYQTNHNWDL